MKAVFIFLCMFLVSSLALSVTTSIKKKSLLWDDGYSKKPMSWESSIDYCGKKGEGWRVPTVQEIVTILDYNNIDPAFNNSFKGQSSSYYWTSTDSPDKKPGYAWALFALYGNIFFKQKNDNLLVKCVKTLD